MTFKEVYLSLGMDYGVWLRFWLTFLTKLSNNHRANVRIISCCAVLREKVIPSFYDNILFGQFCRIHLYTTIVQVSNTIFYRERFFFTVKSVYDQNTRVKSVCKKCVSHTLNSHAVKHFFFSGRLGILLKTDESRIDGVQLVANPSQPRH